MDVGQPAPTPYGVPLYMTFSCVSVTVLAARGLIAADNNVLGKGTSDPYATIELVRQRGPAKLFSTRVLVGALAGAPPSL